MNANIINKRRTKKNNSQIMVKENRNQDVKTLSVNFVTAIKIEDIISDKIINNSLKRYKSDRD